MPKGSARRGFGGFGADADGAPEPEGEVAADAVAEGEGEGEGEGGAIGSGAASAGAVPDGEAAAVTVDRVAIEGPPRAKFHVMIARMVLSVAAVVTATTIVVRER